MRQQEAARQHADLVKRIGSVPAAAMKSGGVAGAMGGARVKVTSTDPQEIILPIPQLTGGQIPLTYFVTAHPADAVTEFRVQKRDVDNVVLLVRLAGKRQDGQITWASAVLLSRWDSTPNRTAIGPFRAPTACVQARSDEITRLARDTWPGSGKLEEFAANIQNHVRAMKRVDRPRSLDALGILKSGENSICTANANLAAALMRSKGIACRSMAVIPTNSQRLEMHRIVETAEKDRWLAFDPSSVVNDVPIKPWQNIIMARSTVQDEQLAMKPRMGVAIGCPYGQELELLTPGTFLFGQDFFWTEARPLAAFDASEAAARSAAEDWARFLLTGTLSSTQVKAGAATSANEFADLWKAK